MQISMSFYDGKLKQQIYYSFTLIVLIHLKWRSSSFPNFDGQIAFPPKFNRHLALTSES